MQPEHRPVSENPARPTLEQIVAGVARGDADSIERFFALATPPVRSIALRALRDAGIWVDQDRLHDIVHDAVLELVRAAPSWRPDGGAAPWTWARPRLVAIAFEHVGIFADDLDDHAEVEHPEATASPIDRSLEDLLVDLAAQRPVLADLCTALSRVANDRDRRVWIELLWEESGGNRRAAITVAQNHGLSHANVRKIRQRVQNRLVDLSRQDEFAGLAELPVLAA